MNESIHMHHARSDVAGLGRRPAKRFDHTSPTLTRDAWIDLSFKVLDEPDRLHSTMLHEMVHAVRCSARQSINIVSGIRVR